MADLAASFNLGFRKYDDGPLITSRRDIALNYFKCWFWVDLVSSVPVDWIIIMTVEEDPGGSDDAMTIQSVSYDDDWLSRNHDQSSQSDDKHTKEKDNQDTTFLLRLVKSLRLPRLLRMIKMVRIFRFLKFAKVLIFTNCTDLCVLDSI